MRISLKTSERIISISPDYKQSDASMICSRLVQYKTSWPNIQMSLWEFFRRAKEQGVTASEAMHCLADEIVPFTIDWDEKREPYFEELVDMALAEIEAK